MPRFRGRAAVYGPCPLSYLIKSPPFSPRKTHLIIFHRATTPFTASAYMQTSLFRRFTGRSALRTAGAGQRRQRRLEAADGAEMHIEKTGPDAVRAGLCIIQLCSCQSLLERFYVSNLAHDHLQFKTVPRVLTLGEPFCSFFT